MTKRIRSDQKPLPTSRQIPQGELVAQPPEHYERNDVAGILRPVQHANAAFVELLATRPRTNIDTGGEFNF
jgi:hypothetical protein